MHKEYLIKQPMNFFVFSAILIVLITNLKFYFTKKKNAAFLYFIGSLLFLAFAFLLKCLHSYSINIHPYISSLCYVISSALLLLFLFKEEDFYHKKNKRRLSVFQIVVLICYCIFFLLNYFKIFLPYEFIYVCFLAIIQLLILVHYNNELIRTDTLNRTVMLANLLDAHFVFNVLMSIKEICYEDGKLAADCIDDFADFLKGNIKGLSAEEMIPFQKEMEHVKTYISLQEKTMNKSIEMITQFEISDFRIPSLCLQPLVENAFNYGPESDKKIKISTYIENHNIIVRVENAYVDNIRSRGKDHLGLALKAIEEKLDIQCKGKFKFEMKDGVAKASIIIPEKEGQL